MNEGLIDSSGKSDSSSNLYGGSSGGSIQIHTPRLGGYGTISANGSGRSQTSDEGYGGIGAGGRIKINLTLWYNHTW